MDYEQWKANLISVARSEYGFTDTGVKQTDWDIFKDYFTDGYTPAQAMAEDSSYA